ncbi:MAG: hypothetical protein NTW28_24060, partial [Candidatus Solibacter sp.]|nr:hypothetical protein [Candidatus Solibacter sp.]
MPLATAWLMGTAAVVLAQQASIPPVVTGDTTVFDPDGTARITRVVPVPRTVSPEAQARLAAGATWAPGPNSPESPKLI